MYERQSHAAARCPSPDEWDCVVLGEGSSDPSDPHLFFTHPLLNFLFFLCAAVYSAKKKESKKCCVSCFRGEETHLDFHHIALKHLRQESQALTARGKGGCRHDD